MQLQNEIGIRAVGVSELFGSRLGADTNLQWSRLAAADGRFEPSRELCEAPLHFRWRLNSVIRGNGDAAFGSRRPAANSQTSVSEDKAINVLL